jgi:hypothetical protein
MTTLANLSRAIRMPLLALGLLVAGLATVNVPSEAHAGYFVTRCNYWGYCFSYYVPTCNVYGFCG